MLNTAADLMSLRSGREKQRACRNGSFGLAWTLPHQPRFCIPLILIILYLNIIQLACGQADAAHAFGAALLHPAVNHKLTVHPYADTVIGMGIDLISLRVERLHLPAPADREKVYAEGGIRRALAPVEIKHSIGTHYSGFAR